ncbi:MAG: peptidase T [Pirellulaceae bacterium]
MTSSPQVDIRINRQRLLDRFLRYVRIGTSADPQSTDYPSSRSQVDFNRMLRDELAAMSIADAHQDENALTWGTVPATNGGGTPTVALVAHVDTSPDAPGDNVNPQVIDPYEGGDIELPSGAVIAVAAARELEDLIGMTLVTTDGTTLLGGDDKAGVAIIMELAHTLIENPNLMHGPVKVLFTCDEEIGRGTDKIDLAKLDATVAYTLDSGGAGVLDVETFSADAAIVQFTGYNIHPAIAKDRMVNALRGASDFVAALPRDSCTPETTDGRDGFIHPVRIRGGNGEATVELILRSFETPQLADFAQVVRETAEQVVKRTPGLSVDVTIREQYRNLREGLADLPEAVELAEKAFANLGRECEKTIVRGGTDGSCLTEKGLPTPNLSSGQHNIHSVTEFACLDEMEQAVEHLIELLRLWGEMRS